MKTPAASIYEAGWKARAAEHAASQAAPQPAADARHTPTQGPRTPRQMRAALFIEQQDEPSRYALIYNHELSACIDASRKNAALLSALEECADLLHASASNADDEAGSYGRDCWEAEKTARAVIAAARGTEGAQ
jgi:hypothetical protein